jgi:hypothetical protein
MGNNKQQTKDTAVMQLLKTLFGESWSTNVYFQDMTNRFLEMEKEQIMDAYRQGVTDEHGEVLDFSKDDSPQRYYNKNYGTE